MQFTGRIVCVALVCLAARMPSAQAIDIVLEPLSATTHPQILDGTFTFDAEPPAFDPTSAGLLSILQSIAADFEDVFEDADTPIRITYWWDADMTFCCGQSIPALMREDGAGNLTHSIVRINPTVAYYIDPTPTVDSEYTMAQRLYSFGPNAITPAQQAARFTGNVPAVFEAGYNGAVVPGSLADGGLRDLLTLAYQEMGHSIGMNAGYTGVTNGSGTGEVDDGDYDVNPSLVNGNVMALLPRGGTQDPLDHLVGIDAVMASLSTSSERTRPSTADYLAIAASQGWTQLDLPRKDFLGGGDWHNDSNWLGGLRALSLDEAYVRHGGAATLSGIGNVRRLTVDNNSAVQTSIHQLVADFVTIQSTAGGGTPRILVQEFGELTSEIVNVGAGTRLDIFGGSAEIERLNIAAGGELRGNGTLDINDVIGQLTNDGIIRASGTGTLLITSDNNLGIDLDGVGEDGEVFATVADLNLQTALTDPFNDQMTIGAGRSVTFGNGGSVGIGGLILLDGDAVTPATLAGSVFFINPGGVVRADGLGIVQNPLFLGENSIAETEDAASEIRFNGTTYLNGGRIVGPGTARQNGALFVGHDTQVEIPTYDLDGQSGNTVITVSPSVVFEILSPAIDTGTDNDFDGTIHVNNGTLEIAPAWRLDGVLNLNGGVMGGGGHDDHDDGGSEEPSEGIAALHGAGGVTVDMNGTINVTGTASVETAVTVLNGLVFVDGDATFSGPTTLGVSAEVEINHADDTLRLMGDTLLVGPSLVGSGRLLFDGNVNVAFVNTSVGTAETDLDGLLGNTQVLINSGLTFSIASITLEPSANDGFDGVITNHGTFSVLAGWRLDGDLEMEQIGAAPTLNGVGPFRIHTTGTFSTDGDAIVNPPTEVAGAMVITGGVTQVNNTISFESTATVIVNAGAELELNGATTFAGGGYTGQGLIQFNAMTDVNADTTIATGRVDLDGAAENTHVVLNNSAFVLNVTGIDVVNNLFAGTIDVTGSAARLEVNLVNPLTVWRLTPTGILNFNTPSLVAVTMLDGSELVAEGRINATGRARLAANVSLTGRLQTTSASTDVHFGSGGQHYIFNTAIVAGTGSMTIDNGSRMHFEDSTLIGIDVENAGRLEVGLVATEVGIDLSAPGQATIRSTFAQTGMGTFAVNLGGHIQGDQYDLLEITEEARLGGTLEISLIDGFVPDVGDMFQILTAAPVINTFSDVEAFDSDDLYGMDVTVLYSAADVVVRIDEVFLLGDYNRNGKVDAADYTIWRNTLNDVGDDLPADGNNDGEITRLDFDVWKSHFGQPFGSGAGSSLDDQTAPEPTSAALVFCAVLMAMASRSQAART